jgi:plasmid stability protein
MTDLLIRKITPGLKRRLREEAKKKGHSLSKEATLRIERGFASPRSPVKMGTFLFSLVEDRDRGHDLMFERNDLVSPPPKFE